ncbi:hypothetical protein [Actinocrinis sp.]|uniref:hypothetical protein n=1 Tax=Actinocrinis sp. TaxID=1920516 RepID=UPI002C22DEF3|nr:hypothetical protein [Actinocrinis sp.]HXR72691.1 hypothetical protein [Actinocrinis sp.]
MLFGIDWRTPSTGANQHPGFYHWIGAWWITRQRPPLQRGWVIGKNFEGHELTGRFKPESAAGTP